MSDSRLGYVNFLHLKNDTWHIIALLVRNERHDVSLSAVPSTTLIFYFVELHIVVGHGMSQSIGALYVCTVDYKKIFTKFCEQANIQTQFLMLNIIFKALRRNKDCEVKVRLLNIHT